MPCFSGLFSCYDEEIQRLLFVFVEWHSLTKLRIHTESTLTAPTLTALCDATKILGSDIHRFEKNITPSFKTFEFAKETAAHNWAQIRCAPGTTVTPLSSSKRVKNFSLYTYKLHALGDYADAIERFGTTDSYSTQIVCVHFI